MAMRIPPMSAGETTASAPALFRRSATRSPTARATIRRRGFSCRAVIVVTHDSRVYKFGDRIVSMSDGQIEKVHAQKAGEGRS